MWGLILCNEKLSLHQTPLDSAVNLQVDRRQLPFPDCINNMDNKRYTLLSIDFGTLCIQISIDISKEQYFAEHNVSELLLFRDVRAYLN